MAQTWNINQYTDKAHRENIPLIDVRSREMFEEGHIPDAVNVPLDEIPTAAIKAGSYLYCNDGYMAGEAMELLAERGIPATDIGGLEDYIGPVEK